MGQEGPTKEFLHLVPYQFQFPHIDYKYPNLESDDLLSMLHIFVPQMHNSVQRQPYLASLQYHGKLGYQHHSIVYRIFLLCHLHLHRGSHGQEVHVHRQDYMQAPAGLY
jgi:hypothetical protein